MATTIPGTWCPNDNAWAPDRDKARMVRCELCGRRLMSRPVYDTWDPEELHGFKIPPHKTKSRTLKRPKGDKRGARGRRG